VSSLSVPVVCSSSLIRPVQRLNDDIYRLVRGVLSGVSLSESIDKDVPLTRLVSSCTSRFVQVCLYS
jgi:hypothetical protein